MTTRRIVGCMTGTSIDAIDAALVEVAGRGLSISASVLATHSVPLGALAPRLRDLAEQKPEPAGSIARLAREFSLLHARAIRGLLAEQRGPAKPIDLVCVHGQTVYHAPPVSWQLVNAPVIAHELRAPVVFDLRAADLASGGQGAPITPIADWVLFRSPAPLAIVNLGGFCNITVLPSAGGSPDRIEGFDVCACNLLLDAVARAVLGQRFDRDGRDALAGTVSPQALNDLVARLTIQSRSGRSLGTGDEIAPWIEQYRSRVAPRDLAASACHAIARCVVSRTAGADRLLLGGGGVHNQALVRAIRDQTDKPVQPVDAAGIPASYREAVCFAVLGALCQDRVAVTLPRITGVPGPAPLAGCWTSPPA